MDYVIADRDDLRGNVEGLNKGDIFRLNDETGNSIYVATDEFKDEKDEVLLRGCFSIVTSQLCWLRCLWGVEEILELTEPLKFRVRR